MRISLFLTRPFNYLIMVQEKPKAGQKFPTPTPGFGDRVFYETLLRQRPTSAMAQEWYVQGRGQAKRSFFCYIYKYHQYHFSHLTFHFHINTIYIGV